MHVLLPMGFSAGTPHKPFLQHPNQVKKGQGPESKFRHPDPHDDYNFPKLSASYQRMAELGYATVTLTDLVRLCNQIERRLLEQGQQTTIRNRFAKRRKPNAFHWLDENWPSVRPIFESAVSHAFNPPQSPQIITYRLPLMTIQGGVVFTLPSTPSTQK
jgi:hypothetical protein